MDGLVDLLTGHLSPAARVWTSLMPALVLVAYFIVGLIIYTIRYFIRGPHRDPEMEARGSSRLANMWIRLFFLWVSKPLWLALLRSRIPAVSVTTLSLLIAIAAGVAIAAGRFALGGWLYLFSGILDLYDGRIARLQGTASRSGAALDSILDRYSDGFVLIGFAWFYRDSWVLLVVLFANLGAMLVSYIRARGEGLGVDMKVGTMQRAERILYLGVATALSPILEVIVAPEDPHPIHRLAVVGLVLLAISTQATALRRFIHLLTKLGQKPVAPWFSTGRGSAFRTLVAAAVTTPADFLLVVILVTQADFLPWVATMVGCVMGGVINLSVNRIWAYHSNDPLAPLVSRYSFVSLSSALLNGGGVFVLLLLPSLDYRLAWVLVRAVVALAWNYPLQREYVFATNPSGSQESQAQASGSTQ